MKVFGKRQRLACMNVYVAVTHYNICFEVLMLPRFGGTSYGTMFGTEQRAFLLKRIHCCYKSNRCRRIDNFRYPAGDF